MRFRALTAAALLLLSAAACGTRVDESSAPSSIVITAQGGGAGGPATPGAATGTATGTGATSSATSGGGTGSTTSGTGSPGSATTGGSGSGAAVAASGEPIRLGAVGTRSGIVGAALENSWRGLTVWQEWVNAHGGIQGRPVEIIQVDDGADPGKHAAAVRRLIFEEHVVAFIGDFAPFTLSAGIPILEENGIPTIGGDGGEAAWFSSPMAFPINGQTVSRARPAAKWALANRPERRAAVFFVSEAAAPGLLAANFVDEWQRGGGQVAVNAGVSLAQIDFTSEVLRAKGENADVVFIVLEKSACNRFFDAARRQSYAPIWYAPACTIDNARDARQITTDRFHGVHAARPVRAGHSPAEDEILQAISQYDPSLPPDGAFAFAWLAGKVLEAAMAQPGAVVSPTGIVDALHSLPPTDLGGLTPTQSWPPGPHAEVGCGLISQFDGEQLNVLTEDFVC